MIEAKDVKKIAELAHLELGEHEVDAYAQHFQQILKYIEQIREVEQQDVSSTSEQQATPFREDKTLPSLPVDRALENAPERYENFFLVPKVVE